MSQVAKSIFVFFRKGCGDRIDRVPALSARI